MSVLRSSYQLALPIHIVPKDLFDCDFQNLTDDPFLNLPKITNDEIITFIKNKINHFKDNSTFNIESRLAKRFNNYTKNQLELSLHGISMEFINITDESLLPIHIVIPLVLLPVFYFCLLDMNYFKQIMCSIFRFKDSYEDAIVDYDRISEIIILNPKIFEQNITFKRLCNIPCRQRFDWVTDKYLFSVIVK